MDNNIIPIKQSWAAQATEKIDAELKDFKGDRYAEAVKKHVASTIKHFCEQNEAFAEVVFRTKRTLSDCCTEIMKGCGNSISDIDVYRGAVRNYFPNADIEFSMTIKINGDAPSEEEMNRVPEKKAEKKVEKKPEKAPEKKPDKPEKPKKAEPEKAYVPVPPKKKEPEIIQLSLF